MVRCAVEGIAGSSRADCDERLRVLLEVGIAACPAERQAGRTRAITELDHPQPSIS
jgi:hypothetical protein